MPNVHRAFSETTANIKYKMENGKWKMDFIRLLLH